VEVVARGKITKSDVDALVAPDSGISFLWDAALSGCGVHKPAGNTTGIMGAHSVCSVATPPNAAFPRLLQRLDFKES
jgi:hypothetical protein